MNGKWLKQIIDKIDRMELPPDPLNYEKELWPVYRDAHHDGRLDVIDLMQKEADAEKDKPSDDELKDALDESVKLQSHYANLLNMHDGGERIQFASADEWLVRLRELK